MRIIVKYSKWERVKYISHLDWMRTAQRAIRRAGIPVSYSQGFNPHPKISFASALSVGVISDGEYMDIFLDDKIPPDEFCDRVNAFLPKGLRMLDAVETNENTPSLMSLIDRAQYHITIIDNGVITAEKINSFLEKDEILAEKKTKSGLKIINIRPMIHSINIIKKDNEKCVVEVLLSSGSKDNLKPEILVQALKDHVGIMDERFSPIEINKREMYINYGGNWITPLDLRRG